MNFIHPLADVKSPSIGDDTKIWQFCIILPQARIGKNCNINCHVFVEDDVIIGNNVTVKPGVQLWNGMTLEDNVFIGPNVTFTNDLTPRSKLYPTSFLRTLIKKGASIGANATINGGITIGEFALIGSGALLTKSVPPFTVWYGNPAKLKGYVTKDGTLIDEKMQDKNGNEYILQGYEPIMFKNTFSS